MNTPMPYAEMLRVQLRKRHRRAPVKNLAFEPGPEGFLEGDIIAIVTADDSSVYRFYADRVELPNSVKVSYDSVSDYHWITKTTEGRIKAAMKQEHYGTLILETKAGESYEMTGLNQAVFPIMSFFRWCLLK